MSFVPVIPGTAESIRYTYLRGGESVSTTLRYEVVREGDGLVLDRLDNVFRPLADVTERYATIAEVTGFPGVYAATLDTGTPLATVGQAYAVTFYDADLGERIDADEIRFVGNAGNAPSMGVLADTFGPGPWTGAVGFATPGDVTTGTTAVNAHTDTQTATLTGTINARTVTIADAVAVVGTATNKGVDALYNRKAMTSTGALTQYADDGSTPAYTATVTDINGDALDLQAGEPARTTALTAVP